MQMTAPPAGLSLLVNALLASALWAQAPQTIEFNRDVRPILSDRCFTCHGPDPAKRKSKLRFDSEAGAMQDLGGHFAIVPGDPAKSELIRRITTDKKGLRMPPAYAGFNALSSGEIETLRRWVQQGAKWQNHWSLIPPKRPELPPVQNTEWTRNPIDRFILARLEREGLKPSREADRATLIRRASLDITGLPPTPAEVEAFFKDSSPDAYEKVVDRLLESPRYGERMAARWLDAARYADTNGYQTDGERVMWRWRDWVIDAFNRNMPFDQFTVEQLAGDLLPNPTIEQRIATGFNRNHRGNGEGGIIPEEYAVEYVIDRVETTSTMWLGLTMGCTRCHDHKYDPLLQKDFYRMYAFFNNIPERGRAWKYGNSPPMIPAPTQEQQEQVRQLEGQLAAAGKHYEESKPEIERAQKAWEKSFRKTKKPVDGALAEDLVVHFGLDGEASNLKAKEGAAQFAAGKTAAAASFDGKRYFEAAGVAKFGFYDKFTISAWIYPTADTGVIVHKGEDTSEANGYGFNLEKGKLQVNLVTRWLDDALRVETEQPVALNQWQHVAMSYDGGRVADGVRVYVNGERRKLKVLIDDLNQTFDTEEPLRVGGGYGRENRFHGMIDEVRIFNAPLKAEDVVLLANATAVTAIAKMKPEKRQPADSAKLARYFITSAAPEPLRKAYRDSVDLRKKLQAMIEGFPTVMVMQELPTPRQAHVLIRGAYDRPGEKVDRGVPGALPAMSADLPRNRLGLAKWLVDPGNPLPARVFMNRLWQQYFGIGIVRTVEDFGSQGEWPVHPELLDWLATEFVAKQWNIKAMVKTIATSAAYRQSSGATPELIQLDPDNRLLARGPRFRMPAEIVRDQALAVSGLLVEKLGGPSVKPYQPLGLWKELSGGADYVQDRGDGLYRRSLYTFWKRTVPPPTMTTFDAAGRETCVVRETRTNTPLQALTLMNDITFVEASRALGQRMMTEGGTRPDDRIAYGYRLATARPLSERMGRVLHDSYYYNLDRYQSNRASAEKLVAVGESKRNEQLNISELAAYTTVASLILNMDQTVTKE